jgi:uncharacterized pyridoxamine 5'-phosphate oxidase family protein
MNISTVNIFGKFRYFTILVSFQIPFNDNVIITKLMIEAITYAIEMYCTQVNIIH